MAMIVIRADASAMVGTGHVMRCLAVAEALQDEGHTVFFALAESTDAVDARLDAEGFRRTRLPGPAGGPADLRALHALIGAEGAHAVVLDGYHFDEGYRAGLKAAGCRVLAWDDLADRSMLHADLVVNSAPQAGRLPYERIAPGARLLLGPSYAALRREIRHAAAMPRRPLTERRGLLLTLGGADPLGLTGPCIERLAPALPEGVRLIAVVGGSNPRANALAEVARRFGNRIEVHVDAPNMGMLMVESGLAVSAGGGTTAELAALAVPTLLVVVADNQVPAATEAAGLGWCAVLDAREGDHAALIAGLALALWADAKRRHGMAQRAAGLIDGYGAVRIARALSEGLQPGS
ncbi:MAG TPA: UDP-2,4-diacetamido-2,4,6-trideoxy-beta-L-altropyranose hydrolase [Azospirillum sp.]|nr:UDP-2,4-diacetamido-2,4,6-trideoxy-beta-L-altropyranose hydrolase [Azospirillum sp.]